MLIHLRKSMMWFVPTRNRPDRLQTFLDGCVDTGMTMPGIIVVDGEDGGDYSKVRVPPNWLLKTAAKHIETCGRMEHYFEEQWDAKFYSIVNDDVVPLTQGWDVELAETAGDWNVAYPDDTLSGEKMATQFMVGGELVRAVGSFGLGFIHTMVDRAWMDIGRGIGRLVYRGDIQLRHDHWTTGRAPRDKTYIRKFNGSSTITHDRERYHLWKTRDLEIVLRHLREIPECVC